jgi:enterochelin esterase-like enzyme
MRERTRLFYWNPWIIWVAFRLTNRSLRDVLRAKEYDVYYQEFEGDHEFINWRGTLADGLIALLGQQK